MYFNFFLNFRPFRRGLERVKHGVTSLFDGVLVKI